MRPIETSWDEYVWHVHFRLAGCNRDGTTLACCRLFHLTDYSCCDDWGCRQVLLAHHLGAAPLWDRASGNSESFTRTLRHAFKTSCASSSPVLRSSMPTKREVLLFRWYVTAGSQRLPWSLVLAAKQGTERIKGIGKLHDSRSGTTALLVTCIFTETYHTSWSQ